MLRDAAPSPAAASAPPTPAFPVAPPRSRVAAAGRGALGRRERSAITSRPSRPRCHFQHASRVARSPSSSACIPRPSDGSTVGHRAESSSAPVNGQRGASGSPAAAKYSAGWWTFRPTPTTAPRLARSGCRRPSGRAEHVVGPLDAACSAGRSRSSSQTATAAHAVRRAGRRSAGGGKSSTDSSTLDRAGRHNQGGRAVRGRRSARRPARASPSLARAAPRGSRRGCWCFPGARRRGRCRPSRVRLSRLLAVAFLSP